MAVAGEGSGTIGIYYLGLLGIYSPESFIMITSKHIDDTAIIDHTQLIYTQQTSISYIYNHITDMFTGIVEVIGSASTVATLVF